MRVAIVEPEHAGHHLSHVRRLVSALAEIGAEVTIHTTARAIQSTQFKEQLGGAIEARKIVEMTDYHPRTLNAERYPALAVLALDITDRRLAVARYVRRVANSGVTDHILVPYGDNSIQAMGLMASLGRFAIPQGVELEGLLMRGRRAFEGRTIASRVKVRSWLSLTAAAPFARLHHLDQFVYTAIARRRPSLGSRMSLMPDPVDPVSRMPRDESRASLGIPVTGRYIGCVGGIDRRKGMDLLLRAFASAELGVEHHLLLAGPHDPELLNLLGGEMRHLVDSGAVISINRYLDDETFSRCISALDVMAAPYPPDRPHSGSSSVVLLAAAFGIPVLGTDSGWIGETIRRFGLGVTGDVNDRASLTRAISAALSSADDFVPGPRAGRLVAYNSTANFAAVFTRRIRERMGLPIVEVESI